MSEFTPTPEAINDARQRRAATSRISAPDWLFSAVIHLLLVMLLVTSKAGPGGGGYGRGPGGDGAGDRPSDAWIEMQMGTDSDVSRPGDFSVQAQNDARPLEIVAPSPVVVEDIAPDPSSTGVQQTTYAIPNDAAASHSAIIPPEATTQALITGDGVSGSGAAGGVGDDGGGGDGSPGEGGDGQGGTSLFGIWDQGERFVYVIDRSSSMAHYGKLVAARSELASSLGRLEESIEFHVLLYNQEVQPLNPRGSQGLVRATLRNKNRVLSQLRVVLPDGGTQHRTALQAALRLRPTVVYLLTDAEDPGLTSHQIRDLARQLRGETRIHCIQFGETPGRSPTDGNWLQQLADATGGQYVHVRTKELRNAEGDPRATR
jgi:hypothetical protein